MAQKGMSLLEVSLVLLLLSILFGFAVPRLPLLMESDLEISGKRLAKWIQTSQDQAILEGKEFRFLLDSRVNSLTLLARDPDTLEFAPLKAKNNPLVLPKGLRFRRFDSQVTDSSTFGFTPIRFEKIFGEEFLIEIDDSGLIDPFEIEIADEDEKMTLQNPTLMGRMRLLGPEAL